MITIITGIDGVIYHGHPTTIYGPWHQIINGPYPHQIVMGGIQFPLQQISPSIPIGGYGIPFRMGIY